jgi:hypothetical protein
MSRIPTLLTLALGLALPLSGCVAPSDLASDGQPRSEAFDDLPAIEEDGAAFGRVGDAQSRSIAGAQVCVDGLSCSVSDADGNFVLPAMETGVAELIRIEADGYLPMLVPVDGSRYADLDLDIAMMADSAATKSRRGILQFITSRVTAEGPFYDIQPTWQLVSPKGSVREVTGARPIVVEMMPGEWSATYEVDGLCAELSGWQGENGHTVTFPIEAGSLTQIRQICVR